MIERRRRVGAINDIDTAINEIDAAINEIDTAINEIDAAINEIESTSHPRGGREGEKDNETSRDTVRWSHTHTHGAHTHLLTHMEQARTRDKTE